ncbi:hypothetical protein [Subtercola endophyticus]|uniref:hypothetical protein n=1 Tax=Subtercola endophyticus TaxID=2895559 RepID=UPI001E3D0CA1|nr:hypothetical protein [Subtercola endophyticus]UFS59482.1 hypothetical protein LQ955_01385 [Subtercola endophyticus]
MIVNDRNDIRPQYKAIGDSLRGAELSQAEADYIIRMAQSRQTVLTQGETVMPLRAKGSFRALLRRFNAEQA